MYCRLHLFGSPRRVLSCCELDFKRRSCYISWNQRDMFLSIVNYKRTQFTIFDSIIHEVLVLNSWKTQSAFKIIQNNTRIAVQRPPSTIWSSPIRLDPNFAKTSLNFDNLSWDRLKCSANCSLISVFDKAVGEVTSIASVSQLAK